jgi:hypothetical protein
VPGHHIVASEFARDLVQILGRMCAVRLCINAVPLLLHHIYMPEAGKLTAILKGRQA